MPRRSPAVLMTVLATVATVACTGDRDLGSRASAISTIPAPLSSTPATTATVGDAPQLRAVQLAHFDSAVALTLRTGEETLYVAEQGGRVWALRNGVVDTTPVLDLSHEISRGSEQGLLGITFSSDGDRLYADFTDEDGDTRVVEYLFTGTGVDTGSRRQLLAVEQPFPNHNGGQVIFGPDGYLYIGLGDGGGAGDAHGNGQRLNTLLGKILRIDPQPTGDRPYSIPADNPFVGREDARPEIWAYGLRNPWRFSFDRETGALWIGDVGQDREEEIDAVEASARGGQNYGWNRLEGTHAYAGPSLKDSVAPVHEYPHANGNCAVTGGYVYRGTLVPGLQGSYIFADYCKGEVRALVPDGPALRSIRLGPQLDAITSFGQDSVGEIYVLSGSSGLYRLEAA